MWRNYFKTAVRNLARKRSYTIINIGGLSVGIAVCLVIFMILRYELSFDSFHSKKDRIYRVLTEYHHADANIFYGPGVPRAVPAALRKDFPQVDNSVIVENATDQQFIIPNEEGQTQKKFKEATGIFFTQPSFFEIFDFPWVAGDKVSALKDPNSIVLTQETAEKYFGDWQQAIGKTLRLNNKDVLKVTGILGKIPPNTDFNIKALISYGSGYTSYFINSTDWDGTSGNFGCYILLSRSASVSEFNQQLRAYSARKKKPDNKDSQVIQPISQVHFDPSIGNFSGSVISRTVMNILWMIGVFILLIACVNFINMSTALAVNRAREVGVRKVLGSNKSQLKLQFIIETFLLVLASITLAVLITVLVLPGVNNILGVQLSLATLYDLQFIAVLVFLTITVTLLAGFYPSIVLSRFNPIQALKSKLTAGSTKGISLRRGLVVFQFIIAQGLIIGTLIMMKQMKFITGRSPGFDTNAVISVPLPGDSAGNAKLEDIRKRLMSTTGIQSVSFNSTTPTEDDNDNWSTFTFDHAVKETDFYAITKFVDNQYLNTYKLPLVAGRNLNPSDTMHEFLVDELLLKNLGITDPEKALNKEIILWGHNKGNIVGVLKQFNARSYRRDLAPVIMTTFKVAYTQAGIKLAPGSGNVNSSLKAIGKIWQDVYPDFVFEYKFLDAKLESFYKQESRLSLLYKIFAAIALFLGCLGLYGLASFMAVQRIKEVGIRKVLGASAANIVYLFSREFILLVGIAFVIAAPLAWYFMNGWLKDYPFRIHITPSIFLIGGLSAALLALITLSFQAIRAAFANPVKSLRSE